MRRSTFNLTVIIEKAEDQTLWGRIENEEFTPYVVGKNLSEIEKNLRAAIADFKAHEGKDSTYWSAIDEKTIGFEFYHDITVVQNLFNALNISALAESMSMNQSLLRQYVSGAKNPSKKTTKEIEESLHKLGDELKSIHLL